MSERGFTLFELLVVLVVMGLLTAIATPLIGGGASAVAMRSAAQEIAAGMRRARSDAAFANKTVRFFLDVEKNRYAIGAREAWTGLPDGLAIEVETARSDLIDESTAALRFFPDGSATGGRVTVGGAEGAYHVMLDWFTGAVTIVK